MRDTRLWDKFRQLLREPGEEQSFTGMFKLKEVKSYGKI